MPSRGGASNGQLSQVQSGMGGARLGEASQQGYTEGILGRIEGVF